MTQPFKPYVPATSDMAEFTLRAVLIGLVMCVVLGAANAYLGLKAGMTIAATYPAAVIGMAVLHFVGAGAFGFAHTLPQINYYTHGSQVTVSHGHLAFYGAYALVNLSFFYFAIPRLKKFPDARYDEGAGHWGFWITSLGLVGMSLAFAVAGVLQAYLERYLGLPYMVAQQPIRFWMFVVFLHGIVVLAGVVLIVKHLLALRPALTPSTAAGGS